MKLCPLCETVYPTTHTTCNKEGCGARLVESRLLEPGAVIRDKYRILKFIGRGGMGTVYLAEHIHLNERHALKFISGDLTHDPKVLKRFRQEAQALRRLIHTNIVKVDDLDQADDGSFYIAMEFVDGLGLREVISAGPLPVERAISIARGVASGLAAAHAKEIIHRDIKPDNILLDHSAFHTSRIETPKLLDFGIAAVKETSTAMSRTRGFMLTAEYAAPEQWMGMSADQIDGRTDLYALGGVLHEMLTGTTCLHSQTFDGWMYQHLQAERIAPSKKRPELANWPGLDALVLSLLAKDRNQRPATAAAVIEQLDKLKQRSQTAFERPRETRLEDRSTQVLKDHVKPEPDHQTGTVLFEKTLPPEPRSSKPWLWIASAAAVLAIGIGWALWHTTQTAQPVAASPVVDTTSQPPASQSITKPTSEPPPATTPSNLGRLTVSTEDLFGKPVSGSIVTLVDNRGSARQTTSCLSSATGKCFFDNLTPGTYSLLTPSNPQYRKDGIRIPAHGDVKVTITTALLAASSHTNQPPPQPGPDPALIATKLANAKTRFESGNDNCSALHEYEEIIRETQGKPALNEYNTQAKNGAEQVRKDNANLGVSCGN